RTGGGRRHSSNRRARPRRRFQDRALDGRSSRIGIALEPLQIGAQVGRVLVAQVAIFFQSLVDDSFQLGWKVGVEPDGSSRSVKQDGLEDERRGIATEGNGS